MLPGLIQDSLAIWNFILRLALVASYHDVGLSVVNNLVLLNLSDLLDALLSQKLLLQLLLEEDLVTLPLSDHLTVEVLLLELNQALQFEQLEDAQKMIIARLLNNVQVLLQLELQEVQPDLLLDGEQLGLQ